MESDLLRLENPTLADIDRILQKFQAQVFIFIYTPQHTINLLGHYNKYR